MVLSAFGHCSHISTTNKIWNSVGYLTVVIIIASGFIPKSNRFGFYIFCSHFVTAIVATNWIGHANFVPSTTLTLLLLLNGVFSAQTIRWESEKFRKKFFTEKKLGFGRMICVRCKWYSWVSFVSYLNVRHNYNFICATDAKTIQSINNNLVRDSTGFSSLPFSRILACGHRRGYCGSSSNAKERKESMFKSFFVALFFQLTWHSRPWLRWIISLVFFFSSSSWRLSGATIRAQLATLDRWIAVCFALR